MLSLWTGGDILYDFLQRSFRNSVFLCACLLSLAGWSDWPGMLCGGVCPACPVCRELRVLPSTWGAAPRLWLCHCAVAALTSSFTCFMISNEVSRLFRGFSVLPLLGVCDDILISLPQSPWQIFMAYSRLRINLLLMSLPVCWVTVVVSSLIPPVKKM